MEEEGFSMRSPLNAKFALLGGALAGAGASACCVGPLVLVSMGIGGAWIGNLTALEPYRPIFIVFVVLFLGFAFRKLYFARSACSPAAFCATERTQRAQKIVFWIAAPLILILVAAPWLLPVFYR